MTQNIETVGAHKVSDLEMGEFHDKPTAVTVGLQEATKEVWSGEKGSTGIWACGVGKFTATREGYSEICYLLEGKVTITTDDGESALYAAGDIVVMPSGWRGAWDVHEPVRKHYTIINDR